MNEVNWLEFSLIALNHSKFIYNIFKGDSGIKESERLGLPLLGQIPLDEELSKSCDLGMPYLINNENSIIQSEFSKIAKAIF